MKYELEYFETILASLHIVETSTGHQPTKETIQAKTERIKAEWRSEVFSSDNERNVELYIQRHQAAIIHLQDQLNGEILGNEVVTTLCQSLNGLLSYLEKHFSKYFDLTANAPQSYRSMTVSDFSERIPPIEKAFREKGLPDKLLMSLTSPFKSFINDSQGRATYKHILYLKYLCTEFERLCLGKHEGHELEKRVCHSVIHLNFNSIEIFNYCAHSITRSFQEKEDLASQLGEMAYYLKLIKQVREKPGHGFDLSSEPLKSSLSGWITEEIILLERKHQLSLPFNTTYQKCTKKNNRFKIETNSSVAQIAYAARLLVDMGVIKNKNKLEVIRFFSEHVSSKQERTISPGSLRKKFYETENLAKTQVREEIKKILEHIDKY